MEKDGADKGKDLYYEGLNSSASKSTTKSLSDLSTRQKAKIYSAELKSNKAIDKQLRVDRVDMEKEVSLLLLGSGEAGKSTLLKQLRLLHTEGFDPRERSSYVKIVRKNILDGLKSVLKAALAKGLTFGELSSVVEELVELNTTRVKFDDFAPDVKALLTSKPVKRIMKKASEHSIPDATPFFFEHFERISSKKYAPTDEDIILSRVMTTAITEYKFSIEGTPFKFIDVAGQRNRRDKWIHFFENVTAMIFVASLANYNKMLWEDDTVNAMADQITLFGDLVNSPYFQNTSVILLLNKRDLFQEKFEKVPLSVCFDDYEKEEDDVWEDGASFIRNKFLEQLSGGSTKVVPTHFVVATDGESVSLVFKSVKELIMRAMLLPSD
eukprot:TRINITY_DN273_c0_g1_i1.p1 TRINITY_DN273_c0_g1~~TRINITY_DN273_c0_g1_i1.p1  ORF type:complete len:441 (+),score=146.30 TRINITY_DN273_c0_g1_i1:179-1324(+)